MSSKLSFFADTWRRKVDEMMDIRKKALADADNILEFNVYNTSSKIRDFTRGRHIQSQEQDIPGLGKLQIEFYPLGETNARAGWCSMRLWLPDQRRIRWKVRIGSKHFGPRDDVYDQKQWWNRNGVVWQNVCQVSELLAEASVETSLVSIAVEVLEVQVLAAEEGSSFALAGSTVEVEPFTLGPSSGQAFFQATHQRPGTAPQSIGTLPSKVRDGTETQLGRTASKRLIVADGSQRDTSALHLQALDAKPAYASGAWTTAAAVAASTFAVKSGHLPPAVAAGRGLTRVRSSPAGVRQALRG